jgi:hypothetical protein
LPQKHSGSSSENQTWFQVTQTGTSGYKLLANLQLAPVLVIFFQELFFSKILVLVPVPHINQVTKGLNSSVQGCNGFHIHWLRIRGA